VPIYDYKCPETGYQIETQERGDRVLRFCPACDTTHLFHRVFSVAVFRPVMPHFNNTVQSEVIGNKDFAEKLKRKGEEYTERTGIETNYKPVDWGEMKKHVTDEGMDATNRKRVAQGLPALG
jgi:putative FmdB family regulatory protein